MKEPKQRSKKTSQAHAGKAAIVAEKVFPSPTADTVIPVLVSKRTGEGKFLDMSKGVYVYAHGCRLLKRLFS